jgi:hypothetical protein
MIAAHLEPKGLSPDTPAFGGDYENKRSALAQEGSQKLLEAILRAQGYHVPTQPPPPPRRRPVRQRAPTPLPHPPECCTECGAPKSPVGGMVNHIQHAVSAYYDLHPSTMVSQRRGYAIAHPRQVAMYLASELTPKSLPAIGRCFGGRDHTTVIHAIRAVRRRIETDPAIATDVEVLRERLGG